MEEQERLKTLLTVLAILLMSTLLGILIFNFWSQPKTRIPTIKPNIEENEITTDITVNVEKETLDIAKKLYDKGTDIWMGISSRNADSMFEKDEEGEYLSITHDYTFNNERGITETTSNYGFYQFKDNVITDTFSTTGVKTLLYNSNGEFIYLNNHYYYADSWTPSIMAKIKIVATEKTDDEITFKVTNNYNDEETEFIIEKENDTWKIKKYEWIFK